MNLAFRSNCWMVVFLATFGLVIMSANVEAQTFFRDLFNYSDGQLTDSEVGGGRKLRRVTIRIDPLTGIPSS